MNERVNFPYGNAFIFDTPHLDRATDRLMQNQVMREQMQARENIALDGMVQREFGKIRSVDTPEVIQNYQTYKQLKKQLLFDKNAQKDPQLYNQLQRESQLALQNTFAGINRSQELLNNAKLDDRNRAVRPNLYDDNYGNMRAKFWNTPMSQLGNTEFGDLSNSSTYLYKGSNTDFQKIMNNAIGTPKQVFAFEEPADKQNLQTKITPYHFGNTPAQVKESVLAATAMHNAGRDAEFLYDQIPQQEIENTIAQYKAITPDRWAKMGLQGPQDLTPRNPQSKAEQYASFLAMQYAINNEPKAGVPQFRDNKLAVKKYDLNDWEYKQRVLQGNKKELMSLREQYHKAREDKKTAMENTLYDEMKAEAINNPREYRTPDGKKTIQYSMQTSPSIEKILGVKNDKGHLIGLDEIRFDNGYVQGIVYKRDDKGNIIRNASGEAPVERESSKRMLEKEFKARWVKDIFGVKEAKQETETPKSGGGELDDL